MTDLPVARTMVVPPRASVLIESMRDIGYSLQTAVADVVDNSITAGADSIRLLADTTSEEPAFGILDNGSGMTEEELFEAMRAGSRSPLEERAAHDLGRFGLGLKTASFSQCRRMTVLTRKTGRTACARWDLDLVASKNDWIIELPDWKVGVRWSEKLAGNGTLVVWERLDRLVAREDGADRTNLARQVDETATHLELVFHRFMMGEHGRKRLYMTLNDNPLEPFDPFHSQHSATITGPTEIFGIGDQTISIKPFTLPHHKKVSSDEWNRYAGPEGYVRNQGFYVYREKRLIIHGTWFNLARQAELTKLSRVRVDMPNGMDAEWKIDVKKASAQLPGPVRKRFRRIIDRIVAGSKRVYTERGTKLTSQSRLPVWQRNQDKNEITYRIDLGHPAFQSFAAALDNDQRCSFSRILKLVEATIPIDSLFSDMGSSPEAVSISRMDEDDLAALARGTYLKLKSMRYSADDIRLMLLSAEPFRSNREKSEAIIEKVEEEQDD